MRFEFLCPACEETTILKGSKPISDKKCNQCGAKLNIIENLVRFERDDENDEDILARERLERVSDALEDFRDRLERLELIILDSKDDEHLVLVN